MQILFDNWTGRYDDECLMPGDIVEAAMVYNFRENAGNQTDTMIQISEGMNEEIDYMTNKLMMQGKSINFTRLTLEQVILSRLER